jgi:RNA recognition motif-containing protein
MILHLQRRFKKITTTHIDTGVPSITDYAVHVTNIPPDTTVEELVNHFSELYQLEVKDFRGRLPVEDAAPVDSTGYSGNELYVGTWVAECTICSKMGKIVTYLEKRKELMKKLYHSRARMKMYGPKTPHIKGFNLRKYLAEEKVMLKLAAKVDKLNEKIHMNYEPEKEGDIEKGEGEDGDKSVHSRPSSAGKPSSRPTTPVKSKKGLKGKEGGGGALATKAQDEDDTSNPFPTPTRPKMQQQKSVGDMSGAGSDKAHALQRTRSFREKINDLLTDAPALAAFVCFEYNESFARCVEDHAFWSYFPMRLCYPRKMLFKGRVLHVTKAPEPDQIVWENIEIGRTQKMLARTRTIVLIIAVLIVVYALFAAAADARSKYVALTPPPGLCNHALPELYAGSAYNIETFLSHMTLSRPPNADREAYDAQCDAVLPDSYYVRYTVNGNLHDPVGEYSLSACDVSAADIDQLCPTNGQSTFCPCLPRNADGQCESMGCSAGYPGSCVEFTTADTLNCYCSKQMDTMLSNGGVGFALSWMVTSLMGAYPDASDECVDTKYFFGASSCALYLAIIVTLVSNKVLKRIIIRNAQAEHHVSLDELNRSIASKIFVATYLNMAIMILLAYGYSTETPAILSDNYLFSGPSRDFDRGWYGTVGFYLVVTFVLMNFPQFIARYYHYYVSIRFKKFAAYKEVT